MANTTRKKTPTSNPARKADDAVAKRKNTPLGRDTEINEHAPNHPARTDDGKNALGLQSLPHRMKEDDDENLLDERLTRRGAGDRPSSD